MKTGIISELFEDGGLIIHKSKNDTLFDFQYNEHLMPNKQTFLNNYSKLSTNKPLMAQPFFSHSQCCDANFERTCLK